MATSQNSINQLNADRTAVPSGQYLTCKAVVVSNIAPAVDTIYFAPVFIYQTQTFTHISFATTVVTASSYKLAIYADLNGKPTGAPLTNSSVTSGSLTTASATTQDVAFGTPVTLTPGIYWLAIKTNTVGTLVNCTQGVNSVPSMDMTSTTGRQAKFADAYANALPTMTSNTPTYTAATLTPFIGLKAQ